MPILVLSRRAPPCCWPSAVAPAVASAIAPSARAVVQHVLLQQRPDLRERSFLGVTWYVVRPGKRYPGHGGRLDRQRAQVFWLQAVHVRLAAGPGEHLGFERQR